MKTPIAWRLYYRPSSDAWLSRWRWSLIGLCPNGQLWAHYIFTTRPTRRQIARTKRGQCAARMVIE